MCELMFPKPGKKKKRKNVKEVMVKGRKRLWSIFTDDMNRCMYTGEWGVERHHVFHHTAEEKLLCEKYGFIAPLKPELHPNGVNAGKYAKEKDRDLRKRCREYYLENYGTEEQFRREFYYVSDP